MTEKPWEGRFSEKTDKMVESFTSSIQVDKRLYRYDIDGSIAHSKMLAETGIITQEESSLLIEGLGQVLREIEHGEFRYEDSQEDIHMHIESRLFHIVGKTALKLHTARSRNDQVALDVRLFVREETRQLIQMLRELRRVLIELAEAQSDTVLPGYTHLQRAQPVILGHHLLAYYEMFSRDTERFSDSLKRTDVSPLGSAALAGTPYPIDRHLTAHLLGFSRVAENSIDAVSDRDFVMEFMAAASICMVHLSRFSEEMVLWASSEFHFLHMPDAFSTGSSIMPQKKNPDVPELVRGKTAIVVGNLMTLLTLMKSLPLSYNRDMQEDKLPLFQTVDTIKACVAIFARMLPGLTFDKTRMESAAGEGFLNATDLADYLVGQGVPFRDAHGIVGRTVRYALEQGKELDALSLTELRQFSNHIHEDVFQRISLREVIDRRQSHGGTARNNVKASVERARTSLESESEDKLKREDN
jgi:argininosuccinate lyase